MASNRDVVQCHIGRRSRKKCGPVNQLEVNRLQTLGELDAPTPNKQIKKISWMILSRIGLNYLVNPLTYSSWTVCLDHRHEFLDYWQVSRSCCHPDHVGSLVGSEMVTLVMSIKILQAESKLLPISGRICISCKERFDDKYGSVAGKKMVIVLPKTQRPIPNASSALSTTFGPLSSLETPVALPSPFIKQEPVDTSREPADAVAEYNYQSSSNVVNAAVPGISLKTEVVEHNSQDLELSENITIKHEAIDVEEEEEEEEEDENEEVVAEVEDDDDALSHYDSGEGATDLSDEESIFSEDSDDDRTWAPSSKSGTGEKRRSSRPVPVKRDFLLKGTPKKKKKTPKPPKEKKIKKPKEPKKKKKPSPPLPKEKADSSEEDKDALIDGGGDNFHYFCKLCQITFYKHSSYKQHVRTNKKTHAEIEAKNKDEEYECTECCIAFMDKKAQIKHMADFHKNPYYCSKCDVQLKSESSFKSHNSKLHLERREKTYYCRECDEIFACKVKQQKHIKTHRLWSGDNPGMQCQICGKVFTSSQFHPYSRHMATHESEGNEECECKACSKVKPKKRASNTSPRRSPSKSSRLERTATASSQEEDEEAAVDDPLGMEEEDADEAEKTFHCALCPHKFVHPEDLEEHVKISHDNEPDVKPPLKNIQVVVKNQAQAQQVRSEMWQTSMERNWAADFGYGKAKAGMPIGDLFSKMKMKFQTSTSTDEEECNSNVSKQKPAETSEGGKKDEDEFEAYRVRGFKGTEKCCLQKAPRTLSASSLVTRKRIAELVVRAREHQIERERKRNLSKNNRSTRSTRAAKKAAASGAVFTEIATTSERTGAIKPHPKKKQQSSSQATATVGTTDQTKTIPEVDRRQVGRTVAPKDSNPSKEVEMGNKSTGDQVQNEQSKIPQLPPPSSGLVENPPAKQKEQNPPEKEKDATPDIGEDSDGYESSDSDSEDELIASLEPQPITEADRAEAEDIVLEVMSREAESIMIPLNNGWVCEKVPVRKSSAAAAAERISKYKNYFWSTEDTAIDPFKSILAIQAYCKKMGMKMNRAIFEKALLFDPDAADRGRENEEVLPSTLIDLEDSEVQVGRVLSPPSVAQPSNLPLADSAGKKVNQRNRPMVQIHNQVTTTLQSNVVVQDEIVTLKIEVEDEATD